MVNPPTGFDPGWTDAVPEIGRGIYQPSQGRQYMRDEPARQKDLPDIAGHREKSPGNAGQTR